MDMTRLSECTWTDAKLETLQVRALREVCEGLPDKLQVTMLGHLSEKYRAMSKGEFISYIRDKAPHLMEGL